MTKAESRTVAYHPKYGTLMRPDGTDPYVTDLEGRRWVSGYWGPTMIFATVPQSEVTVTKESA